MPRPDPLRRGGDSSGKEPSHAVSREVFVEVEVAKGKVTGQLKCRGQPAAQQSSKELRLSNVILFGGVVPIKVVRMGVAFRALQRCNHE